MTSRKHRRSRKARRKVERVERVKPPPEAAQHHRTWPMQALLELGPPGGIDEFEFESALQIVEAFHAMTAGLGFGITKADGLQSVCAANSNRDMSDADARRVAIWLAWSERLPKGAGPNLVAQIEDEQPIASVAGLRFACRLWDRIRSDYGKRSQGVDTPPNDLTCIGPRVLSADRTVTARAPNLPTQQGPAFPAPHTIPRPPSLAGAQMRQASPRSVSTHAPATAVASSTRSRR